MGVIRQGFTWRYSPHFKQFWLKMHHTALLMNRTAYRDEHAQVARNDMGTPLKVPLLLEASIVMVSSCPFCNTLDLLLHFSRLLSCSLLSLWLPCGMKSTMLLTWQSTGQCRNRGVDQAQVFQKALCIRYHQLPPTRCYSMYGIVDICVNPIVLWQLS